MMVPQMSPESLRVLLSAGMQINGFEFFLFILIL